MLIRDFFVKRKSRNFGFTPFYYKEQENKKNDSNVPRIQFRKIRTSVSVGKRSLRNMIILAVLLIAALIYFWSLVEREVSTSDLENIYIEEISSDE